MTKSGERPSAEVLRVLRAQTGDLEALELLLSVVQEPLFRYVLSIVGDRARSADVLQETFVRIWRKIAWLREPELFRPWAFRIASREAFRAIRRDRRWSDTADVRALDHLPSPEPPSSVEPVVRAKLAEMVGALPPASRAVISLVYFEDFTLAEAAAVLEVSPGTVRSRLAYGLAKLRDQLRAAPDGRASGGR